jgi:hypothetical protein
MLKRLVTRFDAFQIPHQFAVVVFVTLTSLFGLFALAVSQTGCTNVCAETAAQRATAAVLVDDATARLDEAKDVIVNIANPSVREQALVAHRAASAALDASRATLAGVKHMCEALDVVAAFANFVKAWRALEPFISLLGGPSAGSQVATPLVVQGVR